MQAAVRAICSAYRRLKERFCRISPFFKDHKRQKKPYFTRQKENCALSSKIALAKMPSHQ